MLWTLYLFCLYMVNYFQPLKLMTNCRPPHPHPSNPTPFLICTLKFFNKQETSTVCTVQMHQHVVQLRQLSRKAGLYSNHLQERLQRRTNEEERSVWSRIARLAERGTAFSRVVAVKYGGWCRNPSRATNARNVCTHGTVRLNWSGTWSGSSLCLVMCGWRSLISYNSYPKRQWVSSDTRPHCLLFRMHTHTQKN